MSQRQRALSALVLASLLTSPLAHATPGDERWIVGIRVRLGWKYDDLRMCGATPRGAPHGPDIDIALFVEVPLGENLGLDLNLPLMRPIMFALAGKMLQFEPEVALLFRRHRGGDTELHLGPVLGLSINYGPDLHSGFGAARRRSFWSLGPRIGAYLGVDFPRPGKTFNYQLGFRSYVTPLWSVGSEEPRRGWVLGLTADSAFRFDAGQ